MLDARKYSFPLREEEALVLFVWLSRLDEIGGADLPTGRFLQKRDAALADRNAPGPFERSRGAGRRDHADRIGLIRGAGLQVSVSDHLGNPVNPATVRFQTKFEELQASDAARPMPMSCTSPPRSPRGRVVAFALDPFRPPR